MRLDDAEQYTTISFIKIQGVLGKRGENVIELVQKIE